MDYISTQEAAARWGVSLRHVQRLLHENKIPGAKKYGVSWLIPADSAKPSRLSQTLPQPPQAVPTRQAAKDTCFFPLLYIHNGDLAAAYACCGCEAERELLEAGLAFFRNEIPAAKALAASVYHAVAQPRLCLGSLLIRGLCAMYEGNITAWKETISQLSGLELAEDTRMERELTLAMLDASMHGRQGYPEWLERGDYSCLPTALDPIARWIYVVILYIKWKEVDLLAVIEPLLVECGREQSDLACIYLHLLAATAYRDHGKTAQAKTHTEAAVELAQPLGIVSPLLEYRRQLLRLMDSCLQEHFPQALPLVKKQAPLFQERWTRIYNEIYDHPMADGLTPREQEACSLYSRGLTAREIGNRMGISPSSVRKYLNNAFNKLDVKEKDQLRKLIHT